MLLTLCLLLFALGAAAQARQPFTPLSNNADTANRKLYLEVMYEKPGCGDYMAMFTLVDRVGVTHELTIDSVLNNSGNYQLSDDRRALMRPTAGGYRLRFGLTPHASVSDSFRLLVNTYKLAYRCVGCGAAGSDAIFEPQHVKAGCPPLEGEVLACHRRAGRMANWEAWIQDPRDCRPYRVVMMPDGRWWFAQNLRWEALGQHTARGSLYRWSEALTGKKVPANAQLILSINSNEAGPQGVCPEGWHVPTDLEWHRLGAGMGSGAPSATDSWQPSALHGLVSFGWYAATAPCAEGDKGCLYSTMSLRLANDESGFTWLPTPFVAMRGVNGSELRHGALWSAGSTDDDRELITISRVVAQATDKAWAASPLMADNQAGHKAADQLPVRCTYDAGVAPTVGDTIPLTDMPCLLSVGIIKGEPSVVVCNLKAGSVKGAAAVVRGECKLNVGGIVGDAVRVPCMLRTGSITGTAEMEAKATCNLDPGILEGAAGIALEPADGKPLCDLYSGLIAGEKDLMQALPACRMDVGEVAGVENLMETQVSCSLSLGAIVGSAVAIEEKKVLCQLTLGSIKGTEVVIAEKPACNLSTGSIAGSTVELEGQGACNLSLGAIIGSIP